MNGVTCEKFLWVCELTKENPVKKWIPANEVEFEDENDKDFVCNSLIVKTAVLGATAVDNERNIVSLRSSSVQDKKEIEQPIFSLTLGRNDMISGLDLTVAAEPNQEVEFKLTSGSGPVYITCMHIVECPSGEEQLTMMTNSEIEDVDEEVVEEMAADEMQETGRGKRTAALKNGNGHLKNGNGKCANGNGTTNGATNGVHQKEAQQA
jgi:hypothetical protein